MNPKNTAHITTAAVIITLIVAAAVTKASCWAEASTDQKVSMLVNVVAKLTARVKVAEEKVAVLEKDVQRLKTASILTHQKLNKVAQ